MSTMTDDDIGTPVELYVYDISKGAARVMAPLFLGKQLDGIWHTAIVAFGREYFFGSGGVESCRPGGTVLGEPDIVEQLGETHIPYQVFLEFLFGLGETTFKPGAYDLLRHNCNNFSNELSSFLCGVGIPKYILDLPEEVLNTPLGQSLRPLLEAGSLRGEDSHGLSFGLNASNSLLNYAPSTDPAPVRENTREDSPDTVRLYSAIEEVRRNSVALEERRNELNEKLQKKERKHKKKKKKRDRTPSVAPELEYSSEYTPDSGSASSSSSERSRYCREHSTSASPLRRIELDLSSQKLLSAMADESAEVELDDQSPAPPAQSAEEFEAEEKREIEERKKQREPPVIFKDAVDAKKEFEALVQNTGNILSPEELESLDELRQYIVEEEGSWALGDNFLTFVGRLLHDKSLPPTVRVSMLGVLAGAALRDDIILLLHQDRREHIIMNYAADIDRLTIEEQEPLALLICNLFENLSSSEWLLYISEWNYNNSVLSNIRVSTKVAVHSLLAESPTLQDRGSAIMHNLACKEVKTVVFDDVATELAMAVLQYFNSTPSEEILFRCMKALLRFCIIAHQEVPQLIKMIGPEPSKFRGASQRVDELIDQINPKLR